MYQELYDFIFSWCENDIEMMFSLLLFMFLIVSIIDLCKDVGKGPRF